jgi:sec-independent protein translocase protein TatB
VFDIGWSEMAIIMLLALIIIGPKDLPRVARTIGQWVRKGRMLAREFQTSLEDMARETELEDVKKEIEKVGKTDFKKSIENTIDPKGELTKAFDTTSTPSKPEPSKAGEKPALTDQSATAQASKETSAKTSANGHANGSAGSPSSSPVPSSSVKAKAETKTAAKKTTTRKTTTAKSPSSKAKTTAKTKQQPEKTTSRKTTSRKTSAAKKPVSSSKKSAKSETSAKSTSTKRSTAKPDASGLATPDDGDGVDQSAVAAKSS